MDAHRFGQPHQRTDVKKARRNFLKQLTAGGVALSLPGYLRAQGGAASVVVHSNSIGDVPEELTGVSYESLELTDASFFSADNRTLCNLVRCLGRKGVLRIGGNSSEFTFWVAPGTEAGIRLGADPSRRFPITAKAIQNLGSFLQATDWKLIYGLNLLRGDPASAAQEAAFVSDTLGERLLAFQLGNEPDGLTLKDGKTPRWTYEEFIAKWQQFHGVVHSRVPSAKFAGPDAAYKHDWVSRFASDTKGKIAILTTHCYPLGPPSDPRMTSDYLLHTDKRFDFLMLPDIRTAKQNGLAYRLSEGNSCYAGGKAGVSDTFASAIWVLDFMLSVAAAGGSGVNIHGGGGGTYNPIVGSPEHGFRPRPLYYGMLLAGQMLGGRLLVTNRDANGSDVKVYASATTGGLRIALINRAATPTLMKVTLPPLLGGSGGRVWRLQAPSISSTSGVTLAGTSVSSDGLFAPSRKETVAFHNGEGELHLDPYSVALVAVDGAA